MICLFPVKNFPIYHVQFDAHDRCLMPQHFALQCRFDFLNLLMDNHQRQGIRAR